MSITDADAEREPGKTHMAAEKENIRITHRGKPSATPSNLYQAVWTCQYRCSVSSSRT